MSVSGSLPAACCKLPPAQADYTPKGTYEDLTGLKTYTVGKSDAKAAILLIYDVFGFTPQALQGADILASQGYAVYMPDVVKGNVATKEMFAGTPEANEKKAAWFGGFPGKVTEQSAPVGKIIAELKSRHAKLGAAGFCWGYKVLVMTDNASQLDALAGCHPSFPAPDDAEKISAPLALLPSQNEDMKIMSQIYDAVEKRNPGKNFVKEFNQVPHGWMAARANLKDETHAKYYQEGYQTLADFYKQYLS